ncbi:MAG: N-acetylneuraminate synthase family protein [Desulfovibrio sp.]|nr:N-acetylneuraminate synthase family protein [Desulfovibrio sp.]
MKLTDIFAVPTPETRIPVPYVIAEAGVNHEGSMDIARRLIDEAAEGGAQAIKFQTYKAGTLASKDSPAYWDTSKEPTQSQYELFKRHDSFWKNEFEALKKHCDAAGIAFMSTPFDVESAHFLNDLMDVFKISSSDITNKPFIRILCDFGKPILLSTGAAHLHEIAEAVEWIEEKGNKLALLHCVLNYPTADEHAALGMIPALKRHFPQHAIGYSDHTLPKDMHTLETATLLGARLLEKHFTHDKSLPGNDHYHAMDKHDLRHFFERLAGTLASVGDMTLRALPEEEPARRHARRSLVTARAVPTGTVISAADLTWKRPAHGISPRNYDEVIGMRARHDLVEDTVLHWSDLDCGDRA